jgi:hypothetical protein
MRSGRSAVLLAAALGVAACADQNATSAAGVGAPASARAPGRVENCFRPGDVRNWRAPDSRTVYLRTNSNRVYRLGLLGPCPDVNWAQGLGMRTRGSPMICSALDVTIVSPSSIGPRRCMANTLAQLTPEEVAALPPGSRP